jgi:hypothetical protein
LINLILIYSKDQEEDVHELASGQHAAVIHVRLALRDKLAAEQRINFAVWDSRVQAGAHPEDVAESLGMRRSTVFAWLAKFARVT